MTMGKGYRVPVTCHFGGKTEWKDTVHVSLYAHQDSPWCDKVKWWVNIVQRKKVRKDTTLSDPKKIQAN